MPIITSSALDAFLKARPSSLRAWQQISRFFQAVLLRDASVAAQAVNT